MPLPPDPHPGADVRASERLQRYLADNDVTCDGCGYNLRGVTTVACPECGRIIASPSDVDPAATLALRCHRCGYTLLGLTRGPCPECGADDVSLADIGDRIARRSRRRIPMVLGLCAACGLLIALGRIGLLIFLRPLPAALDPQLMLASVPVALAPLGLAVLGMLRPRLFSSDHPGLAASRRMMASVLGVTLIAIALMLT